jgi:hypothetical protein
LERNVGIIVVIDKNTPELEEIIDSIATNMRLESHALEFITYRNSKGKIIHLLDKLPITTKLRYLAKADVKTWEQRMTRASPNIKDLVDNLISEAISKLHCIGMIWHKWYAFYTSEPANRKKLFAVIMLGKNTASMCFRVAPEEYKDGNKNIRYVKGFFFPTGTERRVHVEDSSIDKLIEYLGHSKEITENALNIVK